MGNGRQNSGKCFRTGALSGMKRSPRTSTSLEAIVILYFYHWLLDGRGVAMFERATFWTQGNLNLMPVSDSSCPGIVALYLEDSASTSLSVYIDL